MERNFNWDKIENLNELSWIPDRYDIEEKNLFRSPLYIINHLMWNELYDYDFYNQLNQTEESVITLHGYYTCSIHKLYKQKEILIPANQPFNQTVKVRNYSHLREESIHQARLENSFKHENSTLINYLEHLHRIPNIYQYCPPELEEVEIHGDNSIEPYDRIWVDWAIDLVLCLFRQDKEGNMSLVACSDYLVDSATQIYPKSNNYWVDRLRNEIVVSRSEFGERKNQEYHTKISPKPAELTIKEPNEG